MYSNFDGKIELKTRPGYAGQMEEGAAVCRSRGREFIPQSNSSDSISSGDPWNADRSKSRGLLLGILLILTLCGLVESIKTIFTQNRATLIELIIYGLLVTDAIILVLAGTQRKGRPTGFLQFISLWILGLIPYFGWLGVYWAGGIFSDIFQRHRGIIPVIALLLLIGVAAGCIYTYVVFSDPSLTSLPALY